MDAKRTFRDGMTDQSAEVTDRARKAAYMRAWDGAHPDSVRRAWLKRKARVLGMIGGARCVKCGCDDVQVLEINHAQGGGGKEWAARGRRGTLHEDILQGRRSTKDLNVLCRVCNAADYIYRKYPKLSGRWEIRWVPAPHT